jgi:hypothetical protein
MTVLASPTFEYIHTLLSFVISIKLYLLYVRTVIGSVTTIGSI